MRFRSERWTSQQAVTERDADRLLSVRRACSVCRRFGMRPTGDCAGKATTQQHAEGDFQRSGVEYGDDVRAAGTLGAKGNAGWRITHRHRRTAKQAVDDSASQVTSQPMARTERDRLAIARRSANGISHTNFCKLPLHGKCCRPRFRGHVHKRPRWGQRLVGRC